MKLAPDAVTRISQQFGDAELGDPRRSARLARVAAKLAEAPGASIPLALGSDAEVQAAYRLMNNPRVTFEAALEPHIEAAIESARKAREVLLVHDTTECSFPHLDPEEVGYLQTGKAGFRLHYTLAVDGDIWRRPLGVVHAEMQFRAQRRRRKKGSSGRQRVRSLGPGAQGEWRSPGWVLTRRPRGRP
jgi:Transposase DNA-binding